MKIKKGIVELVESVLTPAELRRLAAIMKRMKGRKLPSASQATANLRKVFGAPRR